MTMQVKITNMDDPDSDDSKGRVLQLSKYHMSGNVKTISGTKVLKAGEEDTVYIWANQNIELSEIITETNT
jgi:lipopolysaccharide export system protein LptA